MINTTKSIKATLQSLLERGLVDETFVEDVRDMMLLVDDDDYRLDNIDDVPEGYVEGLIL